MGRPGQSKSYKKNTGGVDDGIHPSLLWTSRTVVSRGAMLSCNDFETQPIAGDAPRAGAGDEKDRCLPGDEAATEARTATGHPARQTAARVSTIAIDHHCAQM